MDPVDLPLSFLRVLKDELVLLRSGAGLPYKGKIKPIFLFASIKSLANSENPFSNPLQEACSGF
jgi:hypothetical protein